MFADSGQGSNPCLRSSGLFPLEGHTVLSCFAGLGGCIFLPGAPKFALKKEKGETGKAQSQSTVCGADIGLGWFGCSEHPKEQEHPELKEASAVPSPGGCWCHRGTEPCCETLLPRADKPELPHKAK